VTAPGASAPDQARHPKASVAGWAELCRRLGARATSDALEAAGADLLRRWTEPHRRYHDRTHLEFVLDSLDTLAEGADEEANAAFARAAVAAWYHDAIYDPTRSDNEEQSGRLATEQLAALGVDGGVCAEVVRLVLLTRTHRAHGDDRAGQLLCDADLAILAAAPVAYETYAAAVRREYGHLSDDEFRAGRIAVLEDLASRRLLFHTPYARQHWEPVARTNIGRELRMLTAT
jgi:predicted metal-dependent HD superfamily phosphohydrolase